MRVNEQGYLASLLVWGLLRFDFPLGSFQQDGSVTSEWAPSTL